MHNKPLKPNGKHLIIDLYDAQHLNDLPLMKAAIHDIIKQTNTTLLFENFHHFHPSGITGIACLAESHISVHTWPENKFAAFDIFVCGDMQADPVISLLKQYFGGSEEITFLHRGNKAIENS
ncbi:MAG: adenosylmethionine decarboxylase [Methylococcales bacterium]